MFALFLSFSLIAQPASQSASDPVLEPQPLAGYANGLFFLRDPNDWFVLIPRGRLQIDAYTFPVRGDLPDGVDPNSSRDTRPKNTVLVRRARVELQGTFIQHFDFHIAGEFASVAATGALGTFADAYIIVDYLSFLKLEVGQFDAPFTLENRTSDKAFDFMERSLAVRAFGVPLNKEDGAMIFGWLPRKFAYYSAGVFLGDGPAFRNQDNNFAFIGRAFISPAAPWANGRKWLEQMSIGASIWTQRNDNLGGAITPSTTGATQDDLPAMTTQGGLSFFSSNYNNGRDPAGNAVRTHLVPSRELLKWAVEANMPFDKFGFRFELVHQSTGLSVYQDTVNASGVASRFYVPGGSLDGTAYYVEAWAWILGNSAYLDAPGVLAAPRVKKFKETAEPVWGLMIATKYEHVDFSVSGLPSGTPDGMGAATRDPAEGRYTVDTFELGLNAWGTKHVRVSANYVLNVINGDAANVTRNPFFGRAEHELLFRLGVSL